MTSKEQCVFDLQDTNGAKLHYDLNALRRPNGAANDDYVKTIQVGPNIQFIYRMNLCANTLTVCQSEPSPATEALKIPAGETCRILGRLVDSSDPIADNHAVYELVDAQQQDKSRNPYGKDLKITYRNGDMCDPAKQTTRTVSMHLVCDLGLREDETAFKEVKKEATCNTEYIFESRLVCPSPAGTSWTRLLVFIVIAFSLYCIIGALVLKYAYQRPWGREVVPNREFWADVPNLVREGCSFSFEKIQQARSEGCAAAFSPSGGGGAGGGGGGGSGGSKPKPSYNSAA